MFTYKERSYNIKFFFSSSPNLTSATLLFLRAGIGIAYLLHGYPKITGGVPVWDRLGHQMELIGINFSFVFWGFLAALSEFIGAIFLIMGFFTRLTTVLLAGTMIVASIATLHANGDYTAFSHPAKMVIVFVALAITGAGKFSLDQIIHQKL